MAARERLDVLVAQRGLAESREKAQALIMAGRVRVGDRTVTKAGSPVDPDAAIAVTPGAEHVGRGAGWPSHPSGRVAVAGP